jgi:hypothetical protein
MMAPKKKIPLLDEPAKAPGYLHAMQVQDLKRIELVALNLAAPGLTVIEGENGEGKSSVLEAITLLVGGKVVTDPVRHGAERGTVAGHFGDRVSVVTVKPDRTAKREMVGLDGRPYPGGVEDWRTRLGPIGLDPGALLDAEDKEQLAYLAEIAPGADCSDLDAEHDRVFAARTLVNGAVKTLRAQASGVIIPPAPTEIGEEIVLATLRDRRREANGRREANMAARDELAQREAKLAAAREKLVGIEGELAVAREAPAKARQVIASNAELRRQLAEARDDVQERRDQVADLEAQLAKARTELAVSERNAARLTALDGAIAEEPDLAALEAAPRKIEERIAEGRKWIADATATLDAERARVSALVEPDLAALDADEERAEAHNARVRAARQAMVDHDRCVADQKKIEALAEAKEQEAQAQTARLAAIAEECRQRLARCPLPVPGLSVARGQLYLDSGQGPVPLRDGASDGQRLEAAARIVAARCKALGLPVAVLLIDHGEALDVPRLRSLAELAVRERYQIVIARALIGQAPVGVVIKGGRVTEDHRDAQPAPSPQLDISDF